MSRRILAAAALALPACAPAPKPAAEPTTTTPEPAPAPPTSAPTTTSLPPVAATAAAPHPQRARPQPVPAGPAGGAADVGEGMEGAQTARASWYGNESGSRTANGEVFTGNDLTFAHLSMAFGTVVRFCHGGACVVARCNDRGPAAWTGKTFDLSRAAFAAIAPLGAGVVTVTWEAA